MFKRKTLKSIENLLLQSNSLTKKYNGDDLLKTLISFLNLRLIPGRFLFISYRSVELWNQEIPVYFIASMKMVIVTSNEC